MTEVGIRNETREIAYISTSFVNHQVLLFTRRKAFMGGRIHHRQPKTNQCPTSNQSPVVHYGRQV